MRAVRAVLIGVPLLVGACQSEQPTFEGMPASYWLKRLKDPDYMARMRAANAVSHLGEAGKPAIPDLIRLLGDKHTLVRWSAAGSLGTFKAAAAEALPTLERLADSDPAPSVRSAAEDAARDIRRALR